MSASAAIVVWNTEWAVPGSVRGGFFRRRLAELDADVVCLTECDTAVLPAGGHVIEAEADYGYPLQAGRRKVVLWSRAKWDAVDAMGSATLPPGRFVAGTTATPIGPMRFIGVCVPWRDAHVRTGRRDRRPWEDHLAFLRGLREMLGAMPSDTPAVLLGDFNQRVPRSRQPAAAYAALVDAMSCGLRIVTAGRIGGAAALAIDHVAITDGIEVETIEHLDRHDERGKPMSDHAGWRVRLKPREA